MRNAFADEITRLAKQDERIVLLSGDIGNNLFNDFKQQHGKRFLNCGVAEQNMVGVAAGMGLSGLRPVIYTITPFLTTRCFEQIRVDVAYHQAPVIFVGTGSGLSYASLGPTHHSLEDMAILRCLPGFRVLAPCDSYELKLILREVFLDDKPTYIRIGKKGEPDVFPQEVNFKLEKVARLKAGHGILFLAAGTILPEVLKAAEHLKIDGLSPTVASVHCVKPLDTDTLMQLVKSHCLIVTVEEHRKEGGLGTAVTEWVMQSRLPISVVTLGTPDEFLHEVGSQQYARRKYGLTGDIIAEQVKKRLEIKV